MLVPPDDIVGGLPVRMQNMRRRSLLGGARRQQQLQEQLQQQEIDHKWAEPQVSTAPAETSEPAEKAPSAASPSGEDLVDIPQWLPQISEEPRQAQYPALPVSLSDTPLPRPSEQPELGEQPVQRRRDIRRARAPKGRSDQNPEPRAEPVEVSLDEQMQQLGADQHKARQLARAGRFLLVLVLTVSVLIAFIGN